MSVDPLDHTPARSISPDEGLACRSLDLLDGQPPAEQAAVLRAIVDDLPDAIFVHRVTGEILFFNAAACRMLGYTSAEMTRLAPFGWIAPERMTEKADSVERTLEHHTVTYESAILHKDGRSMPAEVSARRAESDEGPLVISVIRDATVRKAAEEHLVYLAFHDSLTGLPNRAALEDRLRIAIGDSRRHNDLLALGYIDLDRFKPINDQYGHEVGDQVLVSLGSRISGVIREQDVVARIGGDEFVVVLPRLRSRDELPLVAQRLLAEIRRPITACDEECVVDASIGFSVFDSEIDDARSLVVKADVAMYAAKRDPAHPWLEWEETMGLTVPRL